MATAEKGTYIIGFEVAGAKNLRLENGETKCSPYVVVSCCGRQKKGTILQDADPKQVPFNESMIWSDVELDQDQFETAFIEFAVYGKQFFTRNYLIGKASLQLAFVNKRDGRLLMSKPIALRREDTSDATGILTVTCFVLKPGESVPNWKEASSGHEEAGDADELLDPKGLARSVLGGRAQEDEDSMSYHVFVNIHRVEHLQKRNGEMLSPFVTVEFAGHRVEVPAAPGVERHAWNLACKIPLKTPIFEETILVKLWHNPRVGPRAGLNMLSPDELLAVGHISFTGLRSRPLLPRWFCLYGWDPDEIPSQGFAQAVPEPNFFIGQLLISGRVKVVDEEEETIASSASADQIPPAEDPPSVQTSLMAHVYEVHGVIGRYCRVELQFGQVSIETNSVTKWVYPQAYERERPDRESDQDQETATSFIFDREQGKIAAQPTVVTEDVESQPRVLINVHTKGVLSGNRRVAYAFTNVNDIPLFLPGQPSKPKYYALKCMPGAERQRVPPSVLISMERAMQVVLEDKRNARKNVFLSTYILRAYVFMGRSISASRDINDDVQVTVSCAGMAKSTLQSNAQKQAKKVRPMWMRMVELRMNLKTDHLTEPPSMEPIHLTLYVPGKDQEVGSTSCMYEYMRKKDNSGQWEPYELRPQWIKLFGGQYERSITGELLVAFELLNAKNEPDKSSGQLVPRNMWPSYPLMNRKGRRVEQGWSELRKATLHFMLYGLRDLVAPTSAWDLGLSSGGLPKVKVQIKRFDEVKDPKEPQYYQITFALKRKVKDGPLAVHVQKREAEPDAETTGRRMKEFENFVEEPDEQPLKFWPSTDGLGREGWNYEFLSVQQLMITLPKDAVLEPSVAIIVEEQPEEGFSIKKYLPFQPGGDESSNKSFGEHRKSLAGYLPCNWYLPDSSGVRPSDFKSCKNDIEAARKEALKMTKARDTFQEETESERKVLIQEAKQKRDRGKPTASSAAQEGMDFGLSQSELIDTMAMPCQFSGIMPGLDWKDLVHTMKASTIDKKKLGMLLSEDRENRVKYEKLGQREAQTLKVPMSLDNCEKELNMYKASGFKAQKGPPPPPKDAGAGGRQQLKGTMERPEGADDRDKWKPDFYFAGMPLLKDHDIFDDRPPQGQRDGGADDYKTDWHFSPACYGFVKFALKLTDGWDSGADSDGDGDGGDSDGDSDSSDEDPKAIGGGGAGAWLGAQSGDPAGDAAVVAIADEPGGALAALGSQDGEQPGSLALLESDHGGVEDLALADVRSKGTPSVKAVAQLPDKGKESTEYSSLRWSDFFAMQDDELNKYFQKPDTGFSDKQDKEAGLNRFRSQLKVRVRIYFVRGVCTFADLDGSTNPFIKYRLGNLAMVSMRNMAAIDDSVPDFYRVEERDVDMPQGARLLIEMWDRSDPGVLALGGDEDNQIGSTFIDLEDRWYSKRWSEAMGKGSICKETRTLTKIGAPTLNNGSIEMWVEMIRTEDVSTHPISALQRPPPVEIEVRIVIWDVKDVRLVDGDKSDAFIETTLACERYEGEQEAPAKQVTDTHNGCKDKAEFNWRVIYKRIVTPTSSCIVHFEMSDANVLASIYIGSVSVDITKYVMRVAKEQDSIRVQNAEVKFLDAKKEEDDESAYSGTMRWELYVLTSLEAANHQQGLARSEPNDDPTLNTPTSGRSWADALAGFAIDFSGFDTALLKKVLPIIIFALLCLVLLKFVGLL